MEDQKMNEFSWSMLFIVTACSSFLFNGVIKLMDGHFSNLLSIVGNTAIFLTLLNWAIRTTARYASKKRRKRRFAS